MLASGKSDRCEGSRSRLTSAECDRGRARDQAQARGGTVSQPISPRIEKRRRSSDRALRHSQVQTKETCHGQTSLAELLEILAVPGRRNSRGNWVVQDQNGLRGGLF